METTAELILKGHFSHLKDSINQQATPKEPNIEAKVEDMLNQMFRYLRKQQVNNRLDGEGLELYQNLEQLVVEIRSSSNVAMPEKLPMQKAKGRKARGEEEGKKTNSKTGT